MRPLFLEELIRAGLFSTVHIFARTYLAEMILLSGKEDLSEAEKILEEHLRAMRAGGPLANAGWSAESQEELFAKLEQVSALIRSGAAIGGAGGGGSGSGGFEFGEPPAESQSQSPATRAARRAG